MREGLVSLQEVHAARLRVMSFNIRYENAWDTLRGYGWGRRGPLVVRVIEKHRPDLIGFQEVLPSQLDFLAKRLPDFGFVGAGRDDGVSSGEHAPIFYRRSAFGLLESGIFWLSETPEKPSVGWDAAMKRVCTWARLYETGTGKQLCIFNTHFDHKGKRAVKNSAALLLDRIGRIAGHTPVIVCGDFNIKSDSEAYRILTGECADTPFCRGGALSDARFASQTPPAGPDFTFHGLRGAEYPDRRIIDYIFVKNGVKVASFAVCGDSFGGQYPSDHNPVIADLIV